MNNANKLQRSDSITAGDRKTSASNLHRSSSLSSSDSVDGVNTATTSEGESSDSEQSPKSSFEAECLKLSFPVVLLTKSQDKKTPKSSASSTPRKRSRNERSPMRPKRANNRSSSDMSDLTDVTDITFLDFDCYDDLLPLSQGVEVDDPLNQSLSLLHLMEKIDWHAEEQLMTMSSSFPLPSYLSSNHSQSVPYNVDYGCLSTQCVSQAGPITSHHSALAPQPSLFIDAVQTASSGIELGPESVATQMEECSRAAYNTVLAEFRSVIQRASEEVKNNGCLVPGILPSLKALAAGDRVNGVSCLSQGSTLTPLSSTFCHYSLPPSAEQQGEKSVSDESIPKRARGRPSRKLAVTLPEESVAMDDLLESHMLLHHFD
eukprot:scaffold2914_cov156-Ochromonas_danica.AAC.7